MRLTVVSPFLDRQHGTELCLIEQIERLAQLDGWSIDIYSQRVEQLEGVCTSSNSSAARPAGIVWHKISDIPGPHLLKYLWWFVSNQWQRHRDRSSGRIRPDLIYSAGINCLDADVIVVHILFHEFYERVRSELAPLRVPLWSWPRIVHRRIYYRLIMLLEKKIYRDPRVSLVAVSGLIANKLEGCFGRTGVTIIPNAVDTTRFTPEARQANRAKSRRQFHFAEDELVALLIGNDWKNKGLDVLLHAASQLRDVPLRLLIVGGDDPELYTTIIVRFGLEARVRFAGPSADVLQFYAAADLYVGPSLEDSFGLPIAEAMACGLPVIASVRAGASELIRHGENGLLLQQPTDAWELATLLRQLLADKALCQRLGHAAAHFVQRNCSWDQNAARTREFLEDALRQKNCCRF